ncbi:putative disease resistance protein At3g14460 [Abrus precatorius]|uniref:Disease resistance protein At3g14460 n=1 Tax=Abrus precatorius TaxID=3816 RepID=A0A8B8KFR9_ABRPR|nr:putative disease resistance protein At3g14460 [Abrus precatorius]
MALAMVGEALISASVEIFLDRITSSEFRDFFAKRRVDVSLLDELRIKLLALNAVSNDAEEKQITDLAVKAWLDELKNAVLDAEDLLDEINTETLRCKVEGESKSFTTQVRSLLSSPFNQFYRSLNSKLEAISRKLEHFVKQRDILGLQSASRKVSCSKSTDSLIEPVVVAREDDKDKLLKMLLSDVDARSNNIEVITILGMGGLGKTTLAQYLYNDSEVEKHFDLKAWVWVSDVYDLFKVTKHIFESVSSKDCNSTNPDVIRVELKNSLKDKKILLVLDDLWNEERNDWNQLITPFAGAIKGSRIIVTTRQPEVAKFTHTFPTYELKSVTEEDCWRILANHAFGNEGYVKYPSLEKIGRQIARKCNGLPLAAKTLGGSLQTVDEKEWKRVLDSKLWVHKDVLPALRISYLHLPAHLKRCFAYCSIFPKQHLLDREDLILLWMAEGLLQQSSEKELEAVGSDCFDELLSRSLIQKDKAVSEDKFRMHDLIYDLARLVSGKRSHYLDFSEIPKNVRHLSFSTDYYDVSKKFESFYELKCLRTFLPLNKWACNITRKVPQDLLPKLKCLRVLSLSNYGNITELPDSIDLLVLLRYLDLSSTSIKRLPDATFKLYNLQTLKLSNCRSLVELSDSLSMLVLLRYLDLSSTSIKRLPDATFKLYNLQTLKLSNCESLVELPAQTGNLVNLRHLDISDTNLTEMPTQICRLQDLRTLTSFIVGKEDGLRISELRKFPYLRGELSILKLQNVFDPRDAFQANLKNKEQIEELMLEWGRDPQDSQAEKDVLDNLQPSTMLKKLSIRYYNGTSFPNWLGDSSYRNIQVLCISDCNYCLSLPPFGQLPSLKELVIERMKMVKTVGQEFYCSSASSQSFQPFPLLESLEFEEMSEWEEWLPFEGEGSKFPFPCLKILRLSECPLLRGNLPSHLPSLEKVDIAGCNQLEAKSCDVQWNTSIEVTSVREGGEGLLSLLDNLSCRHLSIEKCDSLQCLPRMILNANCLQELNLTNIKSSISLATDGWPTSLQSLNISNCEKLEFVCDERWHKCTSLERLVIFDSCDSLMSFPLDCFPALRRLQFSDCPLEAITDKGGRASPNLLYFFMVHNCKKLRSLPEEMDLPALQRLWLRDLPELTSWSPRWLPSSLRYLVIDVGIVSSSFMSKQELVCQFQRLTSLSDLDLQGSGLRDEDVINTLLREPSLPTSLTSLTLSKFDGLKRLEGKGLQHLTSLRELGIFSCGSLESLPEEQLPSSLEVLSIVCCPLLEERYGKEKGKHLTKIPAIQINGEVII